MISVLKYITYFILFAVLGWLFEFYVIGKKDIICGDSVIKHFGGCLPMLLVYGVGGMIILYVKENFTDESLLSRVVFAVILLIILECIAGLASRAIFKKQTWNYSDHVMPMCENYISLNATLFWFVVVFVFYGLF